MMMPTTQATRPRTSTLLISDSIQTPTTPNDDATAVPLLSTQATSPRTSALLISDSIQTLKTANDDATAVPLPNLLKQHVQELQLH